MEPTTESAPILKESKKTLPIILILILFVAIGGYFYKADQKNLSVSELSKPGICDDNDGNDIFKKGAVIYADTKGRHAEEDFCNEAGNGVYEWTCKSQSFFSSKFDAKKTLESCKKGCNNGACIK